MRIMSANKRVVSENDQLEAWKAQMYNDINYIITKHKKHIKYKYSSGERTAGFIVCLIGCSPCAAWSIAARLLLSPCMVIARGPGGCCDDNILTLPTDSAMIACVDTLDKKERTMDILKSGAFDDRNPLHEAVLVPGYARDATHEVILRITQLIQDPKIKMEDKYTLVDLLVDLLALMGHGAEALTLTPSSVPRFVEKLFGLRVAPDYASP